MKKPHNLTLSLVAVIIATYGLVVLAALGTTSHILYNLEPYPDGLLYALSARNFATGGKLQLEYQEATLPLWVPPLYPIILVPAYIISPQPWMFYITNALLGVATIVSLYLLVLKMTNSKMASLVSIIVYLCHAIVWWLPTVPMTENLTVLLVVLALFPLLVPKVNKRWLIVALLSMAGLVFTRYAALPVAVALVALLVINRLIKARTRFPWKLVTGTFLLLVLAEFGGFPFISRLLGLTKALFSNPQYYNLSYIPANAKEYTQTLLGMSGRFLWLEHSLSFFSVTVAAVLYIAFKLVKGDRHDRWRAAVLGGVFLSLLPLQLVFYVADSRYLILTVPLIAITMGWLFYALELQKKYLGWIVVLSLAGLLIINQGPLFKKIVVNNVFHRSQAWQYQAIKHFDSIFSQSRQTKPILITALPPHLVDAYQTASFQVVPLSTVQEHMQKGERVWGETVPYDNLTGGYQQWLQQGKNLYITNAYITHQQQVIADYETYKQYFEIELISEGCSGACNIYQLNLSDTSTLSAVLAN